MAGDAGGGSLLHLAATLLLAFGLAYSVLTCQGARADASSGSAASWGSNGLSESSSGHLFRAARVRSYTGPRRFATWTPQRERRAAPPRTGRACRNWAVTTSIFAPTKTVKQLAALSDWCVVVAGDKKSPKEYNVSGNAVFLSAAAQQAMPFETGRLLRWNHFGRKNLGFLYAVQHGAKWVYDVDDDNELQPAFEAGGVPLPRPNALADEVDTSHKLYNLYAQMATVPSAWPRGFPLEAIKDPRTKNAAFTKRAWPARKIGVVQSLADHDPDVDGIYRLTQPLPFQFHHGPAAQSLASAALADGDGEAAAAAMEAAMEEAGRMLAAAEQEGGGGGGAERADRALAEASRPVGKLGGGKLGGGKLGGGGRLGGARKAGALKAASRPGAASPAAEARRERRVAKMADGQDASSSKLRLVTLREGTMMPYNAQATLHAYDALWALLLPCTVHGRVTDIWRAYFAQRLMWDIGLRLAFSTPWVTQYRNPHNYLADFNSETALYQQAGALVDALLKWRPAAASLPGRLEELYIFMYEVGIVGLDDVKLAQAWLADLASLGYRFPPLRRQA